MFVRQLASGPFIYSMIIPAVILDIFLEIYHQTCFRLYAIPLVQRKKYIKLDRHKLQYISYFDKINCLYCGYVNGLLRYAKEIGARTEEYWCGIQSQEDGVYVSPEYHCKFAKYGDKEDYVEKYLK